ncbi:hypothetical protein EsH8_VI_000275 [Colletotrichum jinshuiense]
MYRFLINHTINSFHNKTSMDELFNCLDRPGTNEFDHMIENPDPEAIMWLKEQEELGKRLYGMEARAVQLTECASMQREWLSGNPTPVLSLDGPELARSVSRLPRFETGPLTARNPDIDHTLKPEQEGHLDTSWYEVLREETCLPYHLDRRFADLGATPPDKFSRISSDGYNFLGPLQEAHAVTMEKAQAYLISIEQPGKHHPSG